MYKRILCLAVAVMLVLSLSVFAHAEETDPTEEDFIEDVTEPAGTESATEAPASVPGENTIYFDTEGSGWTDYDVIGFHIWAINDDTFVGYNWNEPQQEGKPGTDGKWFYDLDAAGLKLIKGKQYGVIFYAKKNGEAGNQTYNLIFGTPCIGHTAACEGTIYENPENSNKTTQAAFWDGKIDPAVYGPELQISSIGTVVGTCCPAGSTPYLLFENFLRNTLQNARIYANLSDQELLDNIAEGLGLSRTEVEEAVIESGMEIEWSRENSTLPDDKEPSSEEAAEAADDSTEKSPKTGGNSVVIVTLLMLTAAAGIILARKQLSK